MDAEATTETGRSATRPTSREVAVPVEGSALLLIDVINDLAFEGSAALIAQAEPMAVRLAALKRRATAAGLPTIYVNDNFGQWRSDFRRIVAHCTSPRSPGRRVSRILEPTARDYFVLKPKHSGFFGTTLETLLRSLQVRRVLVTGIAGNICVLFTANDAYMRDLELFAPADCVVSNTAEDNEYALRQMEKVLEANVAESTRLRFRPGAAGPGRRAQRLRHVVSSGGGTSSNADDPSSPAAQNDAGARAPKGGRTSGPEPRQNHALLGDLG